MAAMRWIKKNLGLISIWIASLVLVYNFSKYESATEIATRETKNSQSSSSLINLDDKGNTIHTNYYKLPDGTLYSYNHTTPIIFIGGMPRSGTTLMRIMLDAHPDVRCGEETRLVPRLLGMRANWYRSEKEKTRLEEAGVSENVVNSAMRAFLLEVMVKHGVPNKFLCNKDPFTLKSVNYLGELFPNSKFILMIRDGRATAHSIIERKVTISGFDITSYRDVLTKWNKAIETMYDQCLEKPHVCMPVWYEQLVLHPEENLRKISDFLGVGWSDNMMHHDQHTKKMSISKVEKSTSQVQKPLYLDALVAWDGHIPADVEKDLESISPMLGRLGYTYHFEGKPSYGTPDQSVLDNLKNAEQDGGFKHEWENREDIKKEPTFGKW